MSKHTPGPWALLVEPECTIVIASDEPRIDDKAFGIALIPHHEGANAIAWETKEANGRLIAIAPELLKGCQAALGALRSYQYGNSSPDLAEEIADYLQVVLEEIGEAVMSQDDLRRKIEANPEATNRLIEDILASDVEDSERDAREEAIEALVEACRKFLAIASSEISLASEFLQSRDELRAALAQYEEATK